ncbi:MAG: peptide chain release factor 2 [Acidobacteriota bacterium]
MTLREQLDHLQQQLVNLRGYLDQADLDDALAELDSEMQAPDFWDKPEKSAPILQKRRQLEKKRDTLKSLDLAADDLEGWKELLAEGEEDDDAVEFAEELAKKLDKLELELKLSGPEDGRNAFVAIHPGAGGTESQDWAQMLLRMYLRWAEQNGFALEMIEEQDGDEAGIKSATFAVRGENAYGLLKSESGVHRLVRISPYDSASRRHTSFASVFASPEIDDTIEIDIQDKDLRVDTYRASGAGGQHVNRTDSAVRMTHIPTGIVVTCQNERSQIKNRATAMKLLRSRLYEREMKIREEEQAKIEGEKMDIAWGSQIRSYVLHPYRMVKDHRTDFEIGDADRVLDGDVGPFIEAFLRQSMDRDTAAP